MPPMSREPLILQGFRPFLPSSNPPEFHVQPARISCSTRPNFMFNPPEFHVHTGCEYIAFLRSKFDVESDNVPPVFLRNIVLDSTVAGALSFELVEILPDVFPECSLRLFRQDEPAVVRHLLNH